MIAKEAGILAGAVAGVVGLAMGASGAWLSLSPVSAEKSESQVIAECIMRLQSSVPGIDASPDGRGVAASNTNPSTPGFAWLFEATQATLSCPGWELEEFCAGEKCGHSGWSIKMSPIINKPAKS
ncbi:MAG: hypothetical protein VR70_10930 [Rhodospirillaceae bacterium BRH_c57]|nr:MAG: hypothetical protein VR70_10930 [Rhodospirillaceae bacterium BRH_c57]